MEKTSELSKQQLKSKETKERIFQAAKAILQKSGYENLSIKNICEEAGVSNGSFYHHFKTKDDLLSYYIEEQPSINPELLDIPTDKEAAKATQGMGMNKFAADAPVMLVISEVLLMKDVDSVKVICIEVVSGKSFSIHVKCLLLFAIISLISHLPGPISTTVSYTFKSL